MIHRILFTALVFKWVVTLLLLVYLAVPPGGVVVLAAAHSPAGGKRTKPSKQKIQRKAGGAERSSAGPAAPQNNLGRISLTALDLSRAPTEEELKMAGQLGSPLTPSGPADAAKIADPDQRKKQENDNLLFGQAIQKWNQHNYPEAIKLFRQLRNEHPGSPGRVKRSCTAGARRNLAAVGMKRNTALNGSLDTMRRDRTFIRKRSCAGPFCTWTRDNWTKQSTHLSKCWRRRTIGDGGLMRNQGFNGLVFTKPMRLPCATAEPRASHMCCGKKVTCKKRMKRVARLPLGHVDFRWETWLSLPESLD